MRVHESKAMSIHDSRAAAFVVGSSEKALDEVAYVRFASVYRQFTDINQFMKEVKSLLDQQGEPRSRK